jgi:hypothetical protein
MKILASFEVVDAAVWAYFEHSPATYERRVLRDNAYVRYEVLLVPDKRTRKLRDGLSALVEVRAAHGGTLIEWRDNPEDAKTSAAIAELRPLSPAQAHMERAFWDEHGAMLEKIISEGGALMDRFEWERHRTSDLLTDWLTRQGLGANEQTQGAAWKDHVDNKYWTIIDYWNDGYTAQEIATIPGIEHAPGTIRNIVTLRRNELAAVFGKDAAQEYIKDH